MRPLNRAVASVADAVWVALGGDRRDARRAARLPLPQHPLTPWCRESVSVVDLVDTVDDGLLERGFAEYHVSVLAALLTLGTDDSSVPLVVDASTDLAVAGLLAAATLRPAVVTAVRDDADVGALQAAVRRNRLDMNVVAAGRWREHSAEIVDAAACDRVVIVGGRADAARQLRAAHRTIRQRTPALLVPFPGEASGLAGGTRRLLRRLGYVGYRLNVSPKWIPRRRRWANRRSSPHPYWLLVPEPVDGDFVERFDWWVEELSAAAQVVRRSPFTHVTGALREGGFVHAGVVLGAKIRASAVATMRHINDRMRRIRRIGARLG